MVPFRLVHLLFAAAFALILSLFSCPLVQAHAPVPAYADKSEYSPAPKAVLSVRSSKQASFETKLELDAPRFVTAIRKAKPLLYEATDCSLCDMELKMTDKEGTSTYLIREDGVLVDPAEGKAWLPDKKLRKELLGTLEGLRKAHYGKPVPWSDAQKLVPRKAIFTIVDLESGLRFRGQRRAGSSHADVQPVTKADSAVMKQIYGGHWSWHRRAVLVLTDKGAIAASMHGMPHGGDGIPGNDFKGHFCIHFAGSVTHGSGSSDPVHQVMIQKAAGHLKDYLRTLNPFQISDLFVAAANQKDSQLLSVLLENGPETKALSESWLHPSIVSVRRVSPIPEVKENAENSAGLTDQVRMQICIWRKGSRPTPAWVDFDLKRSEAGEAWRITAVKP